MPEQLAPADALLPQEKAAPGILSIIIVTYNSRQEIGGCLGFACRPTYSGSPVEVILVDNTSVRWHA